MSYKTGYDVSGIDLSQIFAVKIFSDKDTTSLTKYLDHSGNDLYSIFQTIISAPYPGYSSTTGYKDPSGNDFNNIFSTNNTTVPGYPSKVVLSFSGTTITGQITASSDTGGITTVSYRYYINSDTTLIELGTNTSFTFQGAIGTEYTVYVYAYNSNGNSTTATKSNTVKPTTVPEAPKLVLSVSGTTITGTITANGDGGSTITKYEYASDPGFTTNVGTGQTFYFTGNYGSTYTYYARVYNINGYGTSSAGVSVTPIAVSKLFIRYSNPNIQSSTDGYNYNNINSWPYHIKGDGLVEYNVYFMNKLYINDVKQFFVIDSSGITIDGQYYTVNISGVSSYYGLIDNYRTTGTSYSYITVKNIGTEASNSSLNISGNTFGGWIVAPFFGCNGAVANLINNCYNTGPINGYCGGILGSNAGQNGNVTVTNCYNTGNMGDSAGGIFGSHAAVGIGNVTATACYNTGIIGDNAGGIFGSDSGSNNSNSYATALCCYNTGEFQSTDGSLFSGYNGGIFGTHCGIYEGYVTAEYCYTTNNILFTVPADQYGGGIFGSNAGTYGNATATQCYCNYSLGGSKSFVTNNNSYAANPSVNYWDSSGAVYLSTDPWLNLDPVNNKIPYLLSSFNYVFYTPNTANIDLFDKYYNSPEGSIQDTKYKIIDNPAPDYISINEDTGVLYFSNEFGENYIVGVLSYKLDTNSNYYAYNYCTFTLNVIW